MQNKTKDFFGILYLNSRMYLGGKDHNRKAEKYNRPTYLYVAFIDFEKDLTAWME